MDNNHDEQILERLDSIEKDQVLKRLDSIEKTLFIGNGKPGLVTRTADLELKMNAILTVVVLTFGAVITDIATHIPWHVVFN